MAEAPKRRKFRWLRRIAASLAVLLFVTFLIVLFAGPAIIAAAIPVVASRLDIPGRIEVEEVDLSWRGDVVIGRASIYDAQGAHVASASVRTGGGLLGLLDRFIEQDILLDGWATIEVAADGTTNIERALGIERDTNHEAQPEDDAVSGLPFARVVLQGLDASVTRVGSATVALAGVRGEVGTDDGRLTTTMDATLRVLAERPSTRAQISEAPRHGRVEVAADLALETLSGSVRADIADLTEEAAQVLGALSRNEAIEQASAVAARGSITLGLSARVEEGLPTAGTFKAQSQTLAADLEIDQADGVVGLERPGSVRIDGAAFLSQAAIRQIVLPESSVEVEEAGELTLSIERFSLPLGAKTLRWSEMQAAARLEAAPTTLRVPDGQGQSVRVRLSGLRLEAATQGAAPLRVTGTVRAALAGQPEGVVEVDAELSYRDALDPTTFERGFSSDLMATLVPNATVRVQDVPMIAVKPWLGSLERAGIDVTRVVGQRASAELSVQSSERDALLVAVGLSAEHANADATARWTPDAITLTKPAAMRLARPGEIAAAWLPDGWTMLGSQTLTLDVPSARLPMQAGLPKLDGLQAQATLSTEGFSLRAPNGPALALNAATLRTSATESATKLVLSATPSVDGVAGQISADLSAASVAELLRAGTTPVVVGKIEAEVPPELGESLDVSFGGRSLNDWATDALGPNVKVRLDLDEPTGQSFASGVLTVSSERVELVSRGLAISTERLTMEGASLQATPSQPLWNAVAPRLGLEGSMLSATEPIRVEIGPASYAFGQADALGQGLASTSVRITSPGEVSILGVPLVGAAPDEARPRTTVVLSGLAADVNALGPAILGTPGLQASLEIAAHTGDSAALAQIRSRASSDQSGVLNASLTADRVDPGLAARLTGLGDAVAQAAEGSLGDTLRLEANVLARSSPQGERPWTLTQATVEVQSPRLTTGTPITATFTPEAITLAEPTTLTWSPEPQWVSGLIGAKVTSVEPFRISLEQIAVGNPLGGQAGLLDPRAVFIDARIAGRGAAIEIPDRPRIDLDTLEGRLRRIAQGKYSVTAKASTGQGGTLELNGLAQDLTNDQGKVALETAVVRGTLKGNAVPVSIADAMSNTNGLLADSLGLTVDLDAEVSNARLVPGEPPAADLRFSVRGPRADASGYGRIENHVISMPEPQTILTVREVRPEIAERFSELIPELLLVEKRPEDGPAVIQTEGVKIPTNGDWSKGQGNATVALGTARFRTTSLLADVLKATGQRQQGKVGQRIEPIRISMKDGVVTYQPFTLPLGDLTIESEGTVDLVDREMNVLVWLPMAALSDEAAGTFNTGLGSLVGRTIPGFSATTTVPWRVSGPLDSPSIRPAPQVLIQRRGDQLLGPLLTPGQTIQDLLSIPQRREGKPKDGG